MTKLYIPKQSSVDILSNCPDMFDVEFDEFEIHRLYPQGYGKDSPMTELKKFIEDLKELANRDLPYIVKLPPNDVGLPEGDFIPKALLNYIAFALERNLS